MITVEMIAIILKCFPVCEDFREKYQNMREISEQHQEIERFLELLIPTHGLASDRFSPIHDLTLGI